MASTDQKLDELLDEFRKLDESLEKVAEDWGRRSEQLDLLSQIATDLKNSLAESTKEREKWAGLFHDLERVIPFLVRFASGALDPPRYAGQDHSTRAIVGTRAQFARERGPSIHGELTRIWNELLGAERPLEHEGDAQEQLKHYLGQRGGQLHDLSASRYPVELVCLPHSTPGQIQFLLFPLLGKGRRLYPQDFFEAEGATGTVWRVLQPARVEPVLGDDLAKVLDGLISGRLDLQQVFRVVEKGVLSG